MLEGIAFRRAHGSLHLLSDALTVGESVLDQLRGLGAVIQCSLAGSLRRWKEVVGDLDFVVSSRQSEVVLDFFVGLPEVTQVLAHGEIKASVILEGGMEADLRVVSDAEYPFALAYFTGSKEHNIVMRQRAIERGLRLNEYGLFRSKEETRNPEFRVSGRTEADIYRELDLAYIPPELREHRGEFELATRGELPRLIEWTDLRGSLHNHSNWSDGRQSLEDIAVMAEELGCAYWAITDHSRSSFVANGLGEDRLREQQLAVKEINAARAADGSPFRLLTGCEVDILADGRLDFADELLAELDVVVASVHQVFTQDEATMTRRLICAAQNPRVHMLGHLTGRLLLQRDGYRVNQRAVIEACAAHGTWIELNASPQRLDLDWRLWDEARGRGVRCVINCDAHRAEHVRWLRLGVGVARKAGLTRDDVINTRPLGELRKLLTGSKSQPAG
jgi:DNA polymerase (family 10)